MHTSCNADKDGVEKRRGGEVLGWKHFGFQPVETLTSIRDEPQTKIDASRPRARRWTSVLCTVYSTEFLISDPVFKLRARVKSSKLRK